MKIHGERHPPTARYRAWANMMQRCYNPRNPEWKNYGGRGIKVQNVWHKFENFQEDVLPSPGKGWSLDRPKNDEDYGPDNWRWATSKTQRRNQRFNQLTMDKAREIRQRVLAGERQRTLVREFGVSKSVVSDVVLGQTWA